MSWSVELEFYAPLPKLQADSFGSWQARRAYRSRWHKRVATNFPVPTMLPPEPLEKVRLVCTRYSPLRPDHANLAYSFKPIVDGLVTLGVLEDDNPNVIAQESYVWEKAPSRNKNRITVFVEEIEG